MVASGVSTGGVALGNGLPPADPLENPACEQYFFSDIYMLRSHDKKHVLVSARLQREVSLL